jgi:hypothetical protein
MVPDGALFRNVYIRNKYDATLQQLAQMKTVSPCVFQR